MSIDQRISTLRRMHANLEGELRMETARPAPDELTLAVLKKQKLLLKDEINQISRAAQGHAR